MTAYPRNPTEEAREIISMFLWDRRVSAVHKMFDVSVALVDFRAETIALRDRLARALAESEKEA